MFKDFLSFIFPKKCPGCGKELVSGEGAVCMECLAEIRPAQFRQPSRENELYFRFAGRVDLVGAGAMFYFDKAGRMKRVVSALKYRNQPQVGRYLGEVWGQQMEASILADGVEAFVPIPLHPSRRRERGYNQAEEICKGLAKALDLPVLTRSLVRKRKTLTQTRKGKNERWENVQGVFEVKGDFPRHIALVDDVVTTGATIESGIRAIQAAHPATKVTVLALAIASND